MRYATDAAANGWGERCYEYIRRFEGAFKAHAGIDWNRNYRFLDQELAQVVRDAQLGKRIADRFGYELFGCRHYLEFPTVKLMDYATSMEEALLDDPNPFALVTAAHLLAQQTRHDTEARYAAKWRLSRMLYERDWDKQRIIDLFAVIDWLLHLPAELELRLWQALTELERNANMPYVTSVQRLGREEGRQEGRREGIQEGEAHLLQRLLIRRFGNLPPAIQTRLAQASVSQLDTWSERILDAATLEEVFEDSPPH